MRKITLTDKHQELLFQIPLFRDLPLNIKHSLLNRLDISLYSVDKKDIIATQGTLCKKLYVLLEGKLRVDIIDGLGNEVMIEYIVAARAFATPHLFSSDGVLPATFTAIEAVVPFLSFFSYRSFCHNRVSPFDIRQSELMKCFLRDRKSTRLNSSHTRPPRMPSSA